MNHARWMRGVIIIVLLGLIFLAGLIGWFAIGYLPVCISNVVESGPSTTSCTYGFGILLLVAAILALGILIINLIGVIRTRRFALPLLWIIGAGCLVFAAWTTLQETISGSISAGDTLLIVLMASIGVFLPLSYRAVLHQRTDGHPLITRKQFVIAIVFVVLITSSVSVIGLLTRTTDLDERQPLRSEVSGLNELACWSVGYVWIQRPGLCAPPKGCGSVCDIPTKDPGKTCYSDDECEGACLCGDEQDAQGYFVGRCSQYINWTEASDCPCFVQNKSTTKTEAYRYLYCT